MAPKRILPPGPQTRRPLGFLRQFASAPLTMLDKAAPYGDVVAIRLLNRQVYLLNHPDHIKHVLVDNQRNYLKGRALTATRRVIGQGLLTSEGDFHTRQRRLIQPAFHRQRIANYAQVMTDYAAQQMADWHAGHALDLHHELMTLTMKIVAQCLFNTDVAGEADLVGAAITSLLADFNLVDASPLGQLLTKLPTPRQKRRAKNEKTLNTLIYRFIEERRASGEDKGDLLSMLLQARDTEGDGIGMDDQQVRDEVMTLFLAGHETTANALTWTFYLLAQNPTAEGRLHAELDSVLGNRPPTLADLPQLPYTKRVFSEAMRLFPPAWVVGRTAIAPDHIGGYTIPTGAIVLLSQYLMHRHPVYWDQPDQFKPERFESETDRPRYAYFPFGGGPRLCIGEPFAWMEGELLIAALAQQWRFTLAPGAVVEPDPSITLRPKHGLPVVLKKR